MELSTCKVVFKNSEITQQEAELCIKKYTTDFFVHNFFANREIGANKITYIMVDLPNEYIPKIFNDGLIKNVDIMQPGHKRSSDCCSSKFT